MFHCHDFCGRLWWASGICSTEAKQGKGKEKYFFIARPDILFHVVCQFFVCAPAVMLCAPHAVSLASLHEAASNAGVPASWPDITLDAEKAKLLMDAEHARMLLWKGWAEQQATRCAAVGETAPICRVDDHKLKFQASFGQSVWCCLGWCFWCSAALRPFVGRLASALAFHYHLAHAKLSLMNCHPQLEDCRSGDQISFWCRRWPSKAAADKISKSHCPGCDAGKPPWSDVRHASRFMVQPQPWTNLFGQAYLAVVEEFENAISIGFCGTVQARLFFWFHRGDSECYAIYCCWAHPPPSICCNPSRPSMWHACDMLVAVLCFHGCGLVRGD